MKIAFNIFDLILSLTLQQIGCPVVTVSCLHNCLIVLVGGTEMIYHVIYRKASWLLIT